MRIQLRLRRLHDWKIPDPASFISHLRNARAIAAMKKGTIRQIADCPAHKKLKRHAGT